MYMNLNYYSNYVKKIRFAHSASSLEEERPCGKELCSSRAEVLVCFNFVSLPHIHPSLERLWDACRGRKASKREPGDIPETTPNVPNRLPGVTLGCLWEAGPPEGGRGPQGDNPGDPKWASRRRGMQFF